MRSDAVTDSFSDYQSHAACCRLFETHKGKCTSLRDSALGTNVQDVLTASENMPRGSQLYLRMQQEAACVLLGSYLVCFHLLKLQQIFWFRHQLLHLSLSPNTTSTDLHSSLSSLTVYNSSFTKKTSFVS